MKRKIKRSCPTKHVNFYIIQYDDGTHKVKCTDLKVCGDSCPFVKDPEYKHGYKRAPDFKSKRQTS